jgi:hypothetical protein
VAAAADAAAAPAPAPALRRCCAGDVAVCVAARRQREPVRTARWARLVSTWAGRRAVAMDEGRVGQAGGRDSDAERLDQRPRQDAGRVRAVTYMYTAAVSLRSFHPRQAHQPDRVQGTLWQQQLLLPGHRIAGGKSAAAVDRSALAHGEQNGCILRRRARHVPATLPAVLTPMRPRYPRVLDR